MICTCTHCGELISSGLSRQVLVVNDEAETLAGEAREFQALGLAAAQHFMARHPTIFAKASALAVLCLHTVLGAEMISSDPRWAVSVEAAISEVRNLLLPPLDDDAAAAAVMAAPVLH